MTNQMNQVVPLHIPFYPREDERIFPAITFLTGLALGPLLYGAFNHGGYYPYPPPYPPPFSPYPYGYAPYYYGGYY